MIETGTILVADDNSDDIELLKRAFESAGFKNPICYVSDGCELIEFLKGTGNRSSASSFPLLMLLDLNMPQCTGFAVLDWLRKQPDLQNLPTIIFTNSNKQADIINSFRLGAHGYWVKPSRFEDLVKLVVKLKEILRRVARRVELEFPLPVPA